MLVLFSGRSSLGKESPVWESGKKVRMETCNRCWLFWIHSHGELQLQWTADRHGSDSQLDFLLLSVLSREYRKAEKVPEVFFIL